jgi:transcriptional regulator with PAS, ATPase and Fis domain
VEKQKDCRVAPPDDPALLFCRKDHAVDVRVIAPFNKNLKSLLKTGKFQEDLYYHLNVVAIIVPPLRERVEDIPLLAQIFGQKYGTAKEKSVRGLSPEAIAVLSQYSWPGNVRELEQAIERAMALTPHDIILPDDLPKTVRSVGGQAELRVPAE